MTAAPHLLQLHGAVVDLIYSVDALPASGGEAIVRRFDVSPGGGYNAMVSARRAGITVSYGGGLGTGPFSEIVVNALDDMAIGSIRQRSPHRDQGCCTVMLEPSGERSFVASEGAEGFVHYADLQQIDLPAFDWCLLSGYALYYARSQCAFTRWLQNDTPIPNLVFDPAPIIGRLAKDVIRAVLSRATWISANAEEAAILTGAKDPQEAAGILAQNLPSQGGAVVRCGASGCVVATGHGIEAIPAHAVTAIDTNGAGDTHVGAFIAGLALGKAPASAALYANVAAALSTTRYGPATAPDRDIVETALRLKMAG